jgi:dihydroorotate dehydrogenase electron transfer subunit
MSRPMPTTESSPTRAAANAHRDTLFVEDAVILSHERHPGNQYVLRVSAAHCALHARPGSFAHIQCGPTLPLRRPLSIMRADPGQGWIEFLYKDVGSGTHALSCRKTGETINLIGPVGTPFRPDKSRPRILMVGGGVGIPPMIFLADSLRTDSHWRPLVLMGSEVPFPFSARPSRILVPGMEDGTIAAMPLLDDWGVPSRLASLQGYPGCYQGYITGLARGWLKALTDGERAEVGVYACGPHPMLEATARLAREFDLPCQVSLEEFMACAVGGCAGCTVRITTPEGPAMKRVCVDGPVFDASIIDW